MEADDLLCSRNARLEKALVERAQWKTNQPPSLRDNERALEGAFRKTKVVRLALMSRSKKDSRPIFFPASATS